MQKFSLAVLLLTCAAAPLAAQEAEDGPDTIERVGQAAGEIALTPLSDLNLRGETVPEVLARIESPYQRIEDRSCSGIAREIAGLDEALGADIDVARAGEEQDGDLLARLESGASSLVGGLILPFRGIVREISGAENRERRLIEYHSRGIARRAYLKGVGATLGCEPPAAPLGE
ncbi:MAG: hypothetical protein ABR601_09070 [Parasphingopyxis sp.]